MLKLADRVWKDSILKNEGPAWVYFIFAACEWLPTNYRLYSKIPTLDYRTSCVLCLGNKIDTMEHLLECPALAAEQRNLALVSQHTITKWKFPFSAVRNTPQTHTVERWICAGKSLLGPKLNLERLSWMAVKFYQTNCHKQFLGTRHFLQRVGASLKQDIRTNLADSLLGILASEFKLSLEGISNVLSHQTVFGEWCSDYPDDAWFGSRKDALEGDFSGLNTYFNVIEETQTITIKLLEKVSRSLHSRRPTRAVIVGPSSLLIKFDHKLFLPICTLKARSSVLGHQPLAYDLSVLLAANKESMLVDPICWSVFTAKLRDWAEGNCTDCALDSNTDLKFRERRTPHHEARCLPMVNPEQPASLYPFFTPSALGNNIFNASIPWDTMKLFRKLEHHPPLPLLLGILPNQLRTLLKKYELKDREEALDDLSMTIFWSGYRLWKKRKRLISLFYTNSAPDEWKSGYKESKSRKKRRKLKSCPSPFHYLERFCNLSGQRRTICVCSDVCVVEQIVDSMDIRLFFGFSPAQQHLVFDPSKQLVGKHISAFSRCDLIMQSHDRVKKRKED